jgi:XTP/dITP diphosphohydrolase
MDAAKKLYLASSNPGKLQEFLAIADSGPARFSLGLLPGFAGLAPFPEDAPTFAENAAGKAIYASGLTEEAVCADDSGLVVPSLDGEPGVRSARYAGPGATGEENIRKLLGALAGRSGSDREGYFVCALAVARQGRVLTVVSNRADGRILESPRGSCGFGYDPVFCFPALGKTFAELSGAEKNLWSHRGKAFRRLSELLPGML